MDLVGHKVWRNGNLIELSKTEFNLLRYLLVNKEQIVTRRQIGSEVWNINFDTDTNFIDVAVRRLRSKIDEGYEPKLIHTIRGLGYKISVSL